MFSYVLRSYDITTEDGYILKVFRIPAEKNAPEPKEKTNKPVIFLQHGVLVNKLLTNSISLGFL